MALNDNSASAHRNCLKNSAAASAQLQKLMKDAEAAGGSRGTPESTAQNPAPQVDIKK